MGDTSKADQTTRDGDILVPLVLRVPRSSIDQWNTIEDDLPGEGPRSDEEWISSIIEDDLRGHGYTVERMSREQLVEAALLA